MTYATRTESRTARGLLRISALLVVAFGASFLAPSRAHAGGFWITDRGARPMARGFAFVAGADDPQSLWYNPAGLAWSGQQLMLDASYMFFDGTYVRVDSGGRELGPVGIDILPIPIPGAGYSHPINEEWTIGVGSFAPNAMLLNYDDYYVDGRFERCDPDDGDVRCVAPQRYSLQTMKGSALAELAVAAAWRPREDLAIGFGAHILAGTFVAETTLTGCDGAICTRNENPEVDGAARLTVFPVFDIGPTAGITYDAGPIRIGASFIWWPRAIRGTAHMDVRIPSSPMFSGARVEGDEAKVTVDFPLQARLGVEVQPIEALRIEAAVVWEQWSSQTAMTIEPRNIWIRDVLAIGDYQVGPVSIPRNMNDVWSLRLGTTVSPLPDGSVEISFGANYENSSFDDEYLTALTIDTRKLVVAGGVSVRVMDGLYFDASYSHVFLEDRNVTNSAVPQPNAIRPPQSEATAAYIGNGRYTMEANIVAAGLRYQFGRPGESPDDGPTTLPPGPPDATEAPAEEEILLDEPATEPATDAAPAAPATEALTSEEPVGEEPPPSRPRRSRRPRTEADPNPYR